MIPRSASMQSFSIKQEGLSHRLSFAGAALMILGTALSISLTSAGLVLAVIGWIWEILDSRKNAGTQAWKIPYPFLWGIALFGWLFLSLLIRSGAAWAGYSETAFMPSGNFSAFVWHMEHGWNKEIKDAFLILAGLWTFSHSRDGKSRRWLLKWFLWAGIIMVVAGFASVFTEYRLAKIPQYIANNWQDSATARLQHHVGTINIRGWTQHLFMPIGFLNTHLTYAAIAGIFFLYLAFSLASLYVRSPLRALRSKGFWLRAVALLVLGIVLILNNGRSALLAIVLSALVGLYWFIRARWKKRARALWVPALSVIVLLTIAALGLLALDRSEGRMREIATSLTGEEKHTDYQRLMVWDAAWKMALEHPVLGVGPGAFDESVRQDILDTGASRPHLYYPYALIQRGHAHNDLFNFSAIGGLPAALLFLCFWASVAYEILHQGGRARFWRFGLLIVFFGGWFQCFFLDDEVIIPFWALLGLVLPGKKRMTPESGILKS
ncbi:MAG: O-antigen ligase family protein [Leptospiraceae bacterium]|nr:O-antigen ligase family protein [Leptospiraceae bacterium]